MSMRLMEEIGLPSILTVPSSRLKRLPMQLNSVDFPAPFLPRIQKTSPSFIAKEMSLHPGVPFLYEKVTFSTSSLMPNPRPAEKYAAGHTPGSASVPLAELQFRLEQGF